ncbi:MAG: hypothetical protein MRY21_04960 [Simkaniaceae bacterium]|nr:hypothetical protein [Simkaniaceae bacterium]
MTFFSSSAPKGSTDLEGMRTLFGTGLLRRSEGVKYTFDASYSDKATNTALRYLTKKEDSLQTDSLVLKLGGFGVLRALVSSVMLFAHTIENMGSIGLTLLTLPAYGITKLVAKDHKVTQIWQTFAKTQVSSLKSTFGKPIIAFIIVYTEIGVGLIDFTMGASVLPPDKRLNQTFNSNQYFPWFNEHRRELTDRGSGG